MKPAARILYENAYRSLRYGLHSGDIEGYTYFGMVNYLASLEEDTEHALATKYTIFQAAVHNFQDRNAHWMTDIGWRDGCNPDYQSHPEYRPEIRCRLKFFSFKPPIPF